LQPRISVWKFSVDDLLLLGAGKASFSRLKALIDLAQGKLRFLQAGPGVLKPEPSRRISKWKFSD
jgi:hypothetical protein